MDLPSFKKLCCLIFATLSLLNMSNAVWAEMFIRPGSLENKATPVYVSCHMLDIDDIDTPKQSFTANIYCQMRWNDPSLVNQYPQKFTQSMDKIWHPRFQLANRQLVWKTLPFIAEILPNGDVTYRQRIWGNFSQALELHRFPFDEQAFNIILVATEYGTDEIEFIQDPEYPSTVAKVFSLPDWEILGWYFKSEPFSISSKIPPAAGMIFSIHAKRYISYYVFKFIIPLILIACMSILVFWLDPKEVSTRLGLAATSMLTMIAYRFLIVSSLPKVSYLTRMDMVIFSATFLVFLVLLINTISSILIKKKKFSTANSLDRLSRYFFSLGILVVFSTPFILY
jgi:Neurotransmitter-gated ion-channel ligand binding domain/Neurotransmitter-gated ion-channel transmembrane region